MSSALTAVLSWLRCTVCAAPLRREPNLLRCAAGHCFDISRQGHVNLAVGKQPGTGDDAAMVLARERVLAGHFAPVIEAIADAIAAGVAGAVAGTHPVGAVNGPAAAVNGPTGTGADRLVVDVGGGTGHYLAAVLDRLPDAHGVCLDISTPALRRAAKAHERAAAVGADVWQRLPLADGCADVVLNVFAPRNPDEIERILAPRGILVVASPLPEHLAELRPLGLIGIDPAKRQRIDTAFARFSEAASTEVQVGVRVSREDAVAIAQMGPTARHASAAELADRAGRLPDPVDVTLAVRVQAYLLADSGQS